MQPDPRFSAQGGSHPRPYPQTQPRPSIWRYLLPILLVAGTGCSFLFCCCGSVVGYMIFGIERTFDPAEIRAGLEGMADVELPAGLQPSAKMVQITGVESVDFGSASGQSFV